MRCPKHPRASADECWWCSGKPPTWTCTGCGRSLPCEHIHEVPSLTKACAVTRSDLMKAVELYKLGGCDWRYVELQIDSHETEVRSSWVSRVERGN